MPVSSHDFVQHTAETQANFAWDYYHQEQHSNINFGTEPPPTSPVSMSSDADLSLAFQPHMLKGSAALGKPELHRLCELGPTALLPA